MPSKTAPAALAFTDDKVSGSTGCNDFSGTYTSDEEALTITLGPMTQKACGDPAITAQETAVVAQLANVASYTSDDTGLTLKDSSGATVLVYGPGLSGVEGAWTATGVNNGKGAVQIDHPDRADHRGLRTERWARRVGRLQRLQRDLHGVG